MSYRHMLWAVYLDWSNTHHIRNVRDHPQHNLNLQFLNSSKILFQQRSKKHLRALCLQGQRVSTSPTSPSPTPSRRSWQRLRRPLRRSCTSCPSPDLTSVFSWAAPEYRWAPVVARIQQRGFELEVDQRVHVGVTLAQQSSGDLTLHLPVLPRLGGSRRECSMHKHVRQVHHRQPSSHASCFLWFLCVLVGSALFFHDSVVVFLLFVMSSV